MSLPERFPPDDPREWLRRARSNLTLARNRVPDVELEDLCFEAQQAAEKAIKGVLIALGIEFPYVHDVSQLLSLLEGAGHTIPESVWEAEALTLYAVVTRYPGTVRRVTEQDHQTAIALARGVLQWAEGHIQQEWTR